MGSRESRMMGSSQVISDSSIYVFACGLIAALSHIQFGFTCDYYSPTEAAITKNLGLTTVSESLMIAYHLQKTSVLSMIPKDVSVFTPIRDEESKNYPVRTKRHPFPEHIRWSHISNKTIKIDLEENKIVEFIKFDVGNVVMVAGGRNRGRVSGIKNSVKHNFETIHIQDSSGHEFPTRLRNVFTLGKGSRPWGKGVKLTIIEAARQRLSLANMLL
ncbi:LOW QUALITY PROTEIN: hypothetical protein HID58_071406, partial [Brassica napus]